MKIMYHRLGCSCLIVEQEDSGCVPLRRAVSTDEQLHTLGFGPAPSTAPTRFAKAVAPQTATT